MTLKKTLNGSAIVDAMVGVAVGLIILAGLVGLYANYSRFNTSLIETTRLEHEMRTSMALIVGDIRRAGFYGNAIAMIGVGNNTNPFMDAATDLQYPSAGCVLLSYDKNNDGTLPALNTAGGDERYGYRLSNGVLQTRATEDATFACNSGTWENLTNSNMIEITSLTFTPNNTTVYVNGTDDSEGSMIIRNVTISMTGRLANDTSVERTLTEDIRVRNDKYVNAP